LLGKGKQKNTTYAKEATYRLEKVEKSSFQNFQYMVFSGCTAGV